MEESMMRKEEIGVEPWQRNGGKTEEGAQQDAVS